jgi:hypothetical protein
MKVVKLKQAARLRQPKRIVSIDINIKAHFLNCDKEDAKPDICRACDVRKERKYEQPQDKTAHDAIIYSGSGTVTATEA